MGLTCPDCNYDKFIGELKAAYGEPTRVNGVLLFVHADLPKDAIFAPETWARAACPLHAPRTGQPNTEGR